jgi:UDPglucose--hexose-1-phosphate uridylyltransferase
VRAFANLYPALRVEGQVRGAAAGPFDRSSGIGAHEVVVETPHHDVPLWETPGQNGRALWAARTRMADLSRDVRLQHLGWFRNHGLLAGASQVHPHAQILGSAIVPSLTARMATLAADHRARRGRDLLADVLDFERDAGVRMLAEQDGVAAWCAYAPRFGFEVWIAPVCGGARFEEASQDRIETVGRLLDRVCLAQARELDGPDHNVVLVNAPRDADVGFRWHLRVMPRLFAVGGFEVSELGGVMSASPEEAASVLRVHMG